MNLFLELPDLGVLSDWPTTASASQPEFQMYGQYQPPPTAFTPDNRQYDYGFGHLDVGQSYLGNFPPAEATVAK